MRRLESCLGGDNAGYLRDWKPSDFGSVLYYFT